MKKIIEGNLFNRIEKLGNKKYVYAIIGASNNQKKYGYKVLKDLKDFDYNVIPINPKEKKIFNLKTYKNILDVNQKIDVAIFVVPPATTIKVLKQIKKKKINKVWMQPGSESNEAINYCQKNKILYIANVCIILNKN